MCKLSSLFFSFACHWLHVLCWCLVPGTWHWPSCLWKEALQLVCLMRRKESLLGLVTPQKAMVMFHCALCPHCTCLCVMYLCADCLEISFVFSCMCVPGSVACPLRALRITSCSANQSCANVFKIVFHLQISLNISWKCFTSSSKLTCEISAFCWFFFLQGLLWTKKKI